MAVNDTDMQKYIKIVNATKRFKEVTALDNVSLECDKGNITGIIGRNGSGKTVLFKCICGFLQLDSGEISFNGRVIGKKNMLTEAGIIIEEPAFLRGETGLRNLEFLYMINHKRDTERLKRILVLVGLDPKMKKTVSKYSMGMRQRLAIAQAIMEDQEILILDEPMNGLDESGVNDIRELLLKLRSEGKTILIASHNKDDIEILCDSVYKMDRGVIERVR